MRRFFSQDTFFPFRISLLVLAAMVIVYAIFSFLPFGASAADGLIQCGLRGSNEICNICDLIILFQTLVNKAVTYFAAPIAAFMIAYGGFLLVWAGIIGGHPQGFAKGKKVLGNTLIGIIILIAAWLLVDAALKVLGAYQYSGSNSFGPWNVIKCESPKITIPEETQGPQPKHLGCSNGMCQYIDGAGANQCTEGADPKCKTQSGDLCKGIECKDSNVDITRPAPSADCSISGGYFGAIDEGIAKAGKDSLGADIDTVRMVHAIISQESHGDIKAVSKAGACGLMQIKPSSGKQFATKCDATEAEASDCKFYTNPANAAKSVCIGTLLLGAPEVANACGRTVRGLAAGYNGGGGGSKDACAPSKDCGKAAGKGVAPGEGECKIFPDQTGETKRWECLWEDPNHITCNAGLPSNYSETRRYVPKVMYCYNHL